MSSAIQLIKFNCNTNESAVFHKTTVKYELNKYFHCFRESDNNNLTTKINKQLNKGKG